MAYNDKDKKEENKPKYIGAPYNFVPLYNGVYSRYESIKNLPKHNEIDGNLLSGEIEYTFENKTPIFVSNGKKDATEVDFFKNMQGQYAIPGSSIRGCISSNLSILGFSYAGDDIYDSRFMYRHVAGKGVDILRKQYKEILKFNYDFDHKKIDFENVKAGYLVNKDDKYYIYDVTSEDTNNKKSNFYTVKENYVQKPDNIKNFAYIKDKLMYTSNNFYGKRLVNKDTNDTYCATAVEVSYSVRNREVIAIDCPNKLEHNGTVVFTGFMEAKKAFYVVPEMSEKLYELKDKDITLLKDDIDTRENLISNYYKLPENSAKPVFYMGNSYGFTPMIRIPFKHTVHNGIPKNHKQNAIDYKMAMLGFTSDDNAYKSRVYFSDAVTENGVTTDTLKLVLGGPKASSYYDYIVDGKNYNDNAFEIRGIKEYWLHKEAKTDFPELDNDAVATYIKPIKEGATFNGKISFKNLNEDELGLLLWSIKLNDNCYQTIGMAKPYGYGCMKLNDLRLKLQNKLTMYNVNSLSFDIFKEGNVDKYISTYKEYIKEFLKANVEDTASVKALMKIKSEFPSKELIKYMDLKDYQSRTIPLATIDEVLNPNAKPVYKQIEKTNSTEKITKKKPTERKPNNGGDKMKDFFKSNGLL